MSKTWFTCLEWKSPAAFSSGEIYIPRNTEVVHDWRWRENSYGVVKFLRIDVSHTSHRAYFNIGFEGLLKADAAAEIRWRISQFFTEHSSGCHEPFFSLGENDCSHGAAFVVNSWGNKPATETGFMVFKEFMRILGARWSDAGLFYWPSPSDYALRSAEFEGNDVMVGYPRWTIATLAEKFFSTPGRDAILKRQLGIRI